MGLTVGQQESGHMGSHRAHGSHGASGLRNAQFVFRVLSQAAPQPPKQRLGGLGPWL